MWHRAECVFEIAHAMLIFAVHMLALHNEAHLTFVELTVLSLNFIVEAGGKYLVLSCKFRSVYTHPDLSAS